MLAGGRLDGPLYEVTNAHAVDILLDRPLALGERWALNYETTFRYKVRQEPYFSRAVTVDVDDADFRVTFHPTKLPKAVWAAEWDKLSGEFVERHAILLDEYHTARYYLHEIKNAVVGLMWDW